MSSYVLICPHMSSYVLICPHMSSNVLICPHMSSYVLICPLMSSYVLMCPHMSSYVLIYPHMSSCITDSPTFIIFDTLESYHFQKYSTCGVISANIHWHHRTPPDMHQTPPDTTRHAPDITRHALDPMVYNMWGLTSFWDDLKAIERKFWSDDVQTDKQTEFQLVDSTPPVGGVE